MTEKLLEKSRNIFLSLTPPENLIPKKGVKSDKKNRYQNNRIKNLRTPLVSLNSLNKFFHEKSHITHIHKIKTPPLDHLPHLNGNIIPPRDHSAPDELHFAIGGNINQFLKNGGIHDKTKKKNSSLKTPLLGKGVNENSPVESICPEKKSMDSLFFLRWNQGIISLADFIKGRLYGNIWNSLFSNYDLNYVYNTGVRSYKAPIRIKNQHKNELMEYRKIAIFYGNLSKKSLISLMQRSGGSNFLSTLERRLDVVLKRALFFPSIWSARQWIHQGKILVNHEICTHSSYLLQPGDLISIKEKYKNIWKKEWFENSKVFVASWHRGIVAREMHDAPCSLAIRDTNKEDSHDLMGSFIDSGNRFLFPPHLVRKWDKWCQLWGNSFSPRKELHPWSKHNYTCNLSLHPLFNNSVSADNLYLKSFMQLRNNFHKLRYTHRQLTPILSWLEKLYRKLPSTRNQKHYMYQLISSLLLLQQRGRVIDGLFQQRWNRLFTKKKRKILKKKNCQWGSIKPMHLECSYSCATVIYLFTPQKLVWPSHINVLLLKSALNG